MSTHVQVQYRCTRIWRVHTQYMQHAHAHAHAHACIHMRMPDAHTFDLCLKTCDAIHRTRSWTILPTPRAPPCRNLSPESKETRFERHPTADLRCDLSLAYSAGLCFLCPPSRIPSYEPSPSMYSYRRASSTLTPRLSASLHSSLSPSSTSPLRPRRRQRS